MLAVTYTQMPTWNPPTPGQAGAGDHPMRKPRLWPIPNSKTVLCTCGLSPLPAQPSPPRRPGQSSPAFPAHSSERSPPHQQPAQPSPAQALVWALPKLCQRLFLTGFRCCVLGRRNAPFLVRFWPVWGRRAAAFRRFGTLVLGPLFAASQGCSLFLWPSPAQPSPAHHAGQVSPAQLSTGPPKALPKAFSYRVQMLRSRPPERSVFGPFLAGLGPPCRCVSPFWNVGFGTSFCCFPGLFSVPVAQPSPA